MKLTDDQVAAVERQTGANPIPAEDPAVSQLVEIFGEHTFYADPNGLHVLEALPEDMEGVTPGTVAIIRIAEWAGEERNSLSPIEPKALGSVLNLEDDGAYVAPDTSADGDA